jgi:hypothetical protein
MMGAEPPLTFAREAGGVVVVRGASSLDWAKVLRVSVGSRENAALLGSFEALENGVRFRPRFAVDGALDLVVVYDGGVERVLRGVKPQMAATTRVAAIYPSGPEVPANLLKFYLVFDAPMSRGEVWDHLRLLDASGKAVALPFLEIDQELWDPEMKRLTLLFDPGRIKRGVLPREEVGTSLEAGKSYTLAVDKGWRDAAGRPLAEEFRHAFRVTPEERLGIDVKAWEVTASRDEIRIRFGRPMEHALALRLITVDVPGEARLEENESVWVYRVRTARSEYAITVDHRLEDLAGNRPGRPFDVDVFERVTKKPVAETSVLRVKNR